MTEPRQAPADAEDTQELDLGRLSSDEDAAPQDSGKIVGQVEMDDIERLLETLDDESAPSADETQVIFAEPSEND